MNAKLTPAQQRTWKMIADAYQYQVRGDYSGSFVVNEDGEMQSVYGSRINGLTLQAIAKAGLIVFTDGTRFKHPHFKLTRQGLDALPDVADDEDTPRFGAGGGNPAADLDTVDSIIDPAKLAQVEADTAYIRQRLNTGMPECRNACDMAERIAPQAHISEPAALALAQKIVDLKITASQIIVGTALYGFDTTLYGVIYAAADGTYQMLSGWLKNDRLYTLHTGYSHSLETVRWNFSRYQEAVMFEVAI